MDTERLHYIKEMESHGATNGWVSPLSDKDREYLVHFRAVCKRYNIDPSRATQLEYDFVTKVTDAELSGDAMSQKPRPQEVPTWDSLSDDEKIDAVAAWIMEQHRAAFEELAK